MNLKCVRCNNDLLFLVANRWYSVITSNENVYALSTPSSTRNLEKVCTTVQLEISKSTYIGLFALSLCSL